MLIRTWTLYRHHDNFQHMRNLAKGSDDTAVSAIGQFKKNSILYTNMYKLLICVQLWPDRHATIQNINWLCDNKISCPISNLKSCDVAVFFFRMERVNLTPSRKNRVNLDIFNLWWFVLLLTTKRSENLKANGQSFHRSFPLGKFNRSHFRKLNSNFRKEDGFCNHSL